jgi:hypothetical protein
MGKFMVEYGCSHLGGRMYQENLSELLYSLFNTIPDPFMVIGEDGTYLEVFGGTERSLYDDGKPMQGKNIYEFMPKGVCRFLHAAGTSYPGNELPQLVRLST